MIGCLHNDREDVDTIKVVLETLLMLFTPEETSVGEIDGSLGGREMLIHSAARSVRRDRSLAGR